MNLLKMEKQPRHSANYITNTPNAAVFSIGLGGHVEYPFPRGEPTPTSCVREEWPHDGHEYWFWVMPEKQNPADPEMTLVKAQGQFESIVVIGKDASGKMAVINSDMSLADLLLMLEITKTEIVNLARSQC